MGHRDNVYDHEEETLIFLICLLIHNTPIFHLSKQQSAIASTIVKNQAVYSCFDKELVSFTLEILPKHILLYIQENNDTIYHSLTFN